MAIQLSAKILPLDKKLTNRIIIQYFCTKAYAKKNVLHF